MTKKNKFVIAIIAIIFVMAAGLLYSLRLILSENQIKSLVTDFVAKEVKGAKGTISEVHLNFRRTLEIHLDQMSVVGPDGLAVDAERIMLSIPYGNFIFGKGKFDVRVSNARVSYGSEMTTTGIVRAIELLESVPQIVGLDGEVNIKLSDPTFSPSLVFADYYRPEISRLVVNNIGRREELAIEIIGDLMNQDSRRPFTFIGSLNPVKKTLNASFNIENLSFPVRGFNAASMKLEMSYKDGGLELEGESEDLVTMKLSSLAETSQLKLERIYFPISNTPLSTFWSGARGREGITLSGLWNPQDESSLIDIDKSELHITVEDKEYDALIAGQVGSQRQNYVIDFWLPDEKGTLRLDYFENEVESIELYAQGMNFSRIGDHELLRKLQSLGVTSERVRYEADFKDIVLDQYVVDAKLSFLEGRKSGEVTIPAQRSKLTFSDEKGELVVNVTQVPCRLIAFLLKQGGFEGTCGGKLTYSHGAKRGSFNLRWEPEGGTVEITKLSPVAIAGGLEQQWNIAGTVVGDEVTITSIGGRKFYFEGLAKGSLSQKSLTIKGNLRDKKQVIAPINLELSKDGVRTLSAGE